MGWKGDKPINEGLIEVAREAVQALARLDASQLEELAIGCSALQGRVNSGVASRGEVDPAMRTALAVLGRMLDLTRTSIQALRRTQGDKIEYGPEPQSGRFLGWS